MLRIEFTENVGIGFNTVMEWEGVQRYNSRIHKIVLSELNFCLDRIAFLFKDPEMYSHRVDIKAEAKVYVDGKFCFSVIACVLHGKIRIFGIHRIYTQTIRRIYNYRAA